MLHLFIAALFTLLPLPISTDQPAQPPVKPPMKTEEMKKATPPAQPPFQDPEVTYEAMFMKTMLVLLSMLLFVAFCIWLFKKMNHGRLNQMNHHKTIKILETRPISPKTLLYLVEVGDRRILLSESQLDVRQLTTLEFPEENQTT